MQHANWCAIHLVGEDRQCVAHILDLVNVIVAAAVGAIGQRIEHGEASLRYRLHQLADELRERAPITGVV
jgi:hypothetical protein